MECRNDGVVVKSKCSFPSFCFFFSPLSLFLFLFVFLLPPLPIRKLELYSVLSFSFFFLSSSFQVLLT